MILRHGCISHAFLFHSLLFHRPYVNHKWRFAGTSQSRGYTSPARGPAHQIDPPVPSLLAQLGSLRRHKLWTETLELVRCSPFDDHDEDPSSSSSCNPAEAIYTNDVRVANIALQAARRIEEWDTVWRIYSTFLHNCRKNSAASPTNSTSSNGYNYNVKPDIFMFNQILKTLACHQGNGPYTVQQVLCDMQAFDLELNQDSVPSLLIIYYHLDDQDSLDALFTALTTSEQGLLSVRAVQILLHLYGESKDVGRMLQLLEAAITRRVFPATLLGEFLGALRPACSPMELVAALEMIVNKAHIPVSPPILWVTLQMVEQGRDLDAAVRLVALAERLCDISPHTRDQWEMDRFYCTLALCYAAGFQYQRMIEVLQQCQSIDSSAEWETSLHSIATSLAAGGRGVIKGAKDHLLGQDVLHPASTQVVAMAFAMTHLSVATVQFLEELLRRNSLTGPILISVADCWAHMPNENRLSYLYSLAQLASVSYDDIVTIHLRTLQASLRQKYVPTAQRSYKWLADRAIPLPPDTLELVARIAARHRRLLWATEALEGLRSGGHEVSPALVQYCWLHLRRVRFNEKLFIWVKNAGMEEHLQHMAFKEPESELGLECKDQPTQKSLSTTSSVE